MGELSTMIDHILAYGRMVKFSHTIFALPFALSAAVLSFRVKPVRLSEIIWLLVAMVGARSAAMGFNRIVDAKIDKQNPRTANREIPSGSLTLQSAYIFVVIFSLVFILAAGMLGPLCLYFSVPVLILLFFYSYTKRFTWLAHLYLGFAISLAPMGAWIALAKTFHWPVLLLSMALMAYIAGFDILYACQDLEFDRDHGLHSIPAKFGAKKALRIAAMLHGCAFLFFAALYFAFQMGMIYLFTVLVIGVLLIAEHRLVKPDDLTSVNVAFFHVNSVISTVLFAGVLMDELI
jgi:4-hydroxybenzoate polyprenyltransferase